MTGYQYFIAGIVNAATLHNYVLANSTLAPLAGHVELGQGTNTSATAGFYVAIYFTAVLSGDQKTALDAIVANYH